MVGLVSGVGLLVCIYSLSYFSRRTPGTGRLAGLLTLFAGAMLGVVLSDHLLSLFVFWELTSITSYLLIGNDDRNPRARDAALSAILITGAGGLAMLAGLILIGQAAGTYRLSELVAAAPTGSLVGAGLILVLVGRVHQVGPAAVRRLAARRDGRPDADQHLPPRRDDGESGRVPGRAAGPGPRRSRSVAPDRARRVVGDDDRRRLAGAAPARPEAAARLRHRQPARLHDAAVRDGPLRPRPGRHRAARRPRRVQGRTVHGGRHRRPPGRHARRATAARVPPRVVAGDRGRGAGSSLDGRRAATARFRRQGEGPRRRGRTATSVELRHWWPS